MQTRPEDLLLAEKITDKITTNNATTAIDDETAAKTIVDMLNIPELRPILEFFAQDNSKFIVIIDMEKTYVEYSDAGVYFSSQDFMHINGNQSDDAEANKEAVRKSLLFGLCQFAMIKIFNNDGKPYSANDDDNKMRFSSACWEALGNRNVGRMNDEYRKHYLSFPGDMAEKSSIALFHTEAFAHIAKFIWQDKSSELVAKLYPKLASYYREVILTALIARLDNQEQKQKFVNPAAVSGTVFSSNEERKVPMAAPVQRMNPPMMK